MTTRSTGIFRSGSYIEYMVIPSLTDPSVAPPGKACDVVLFVQYATL